MTGLVKARLAEIGAGDNPSEVPGTSVDVQFNPTTLRVQISNRTAGGSQAGAQARQRPGTGEMQVGFDLVFDTADEGSAGEGVNVLERTAMVERFVRPRSTRPGEEAPPRVLFVWGSFQVQGTMDSANLDLDLFDADGTPLRAKVAVSIKGQDPRWAYTPATTAPGGVQGAGSGDTRPGGAARPGNGNSLGAGAPGTAGGAGAVAAVLQALPGESLAQLAARAGVAPAAWRALAGGVNGGVTGGLAASTPGLGGAGSGTGSGSGGGGGGSATALALGQEVALPAGLAASGGAAAGAGGSAAADPAATRAALPLSAAAPGLGAAAIASAAAARSAADPVRAGQALAAQGGLQGAIAARQEGLHQDTAAQRLAAFGLAGRPAALDARPWGAGIPLRPRQGGAAGVAAASVAPGAAAASTSPTPRWRRACGCAGGTGGAGRCGCR